jgi:hypothetical protein
LRNLTALREIAGHDAEDEDVALAPARRAVWPN